MNKMIRRSMRKIYRGQKGITGLETAIILIAFVVVASVFAYTVLSAGLFSTEESQEAINTGLDEAQSTIQVRGPVMAYADQQVEVDPVGDPDFYLNVDGDTSGAVDDEKDDDPPNYDDRLAITKVEFMVACMAGGEAVDLTPPYSTPPAQATEPTAGDLEDDSQTTITYTDDSTMITECCWSVEWIGVNSNDWILDPGEKAKITVYLLWDDTDFSGWALGSSNSSFMSDRDKLIGPNHTFMLEVKTVSGAILPIERTTPGYLDIMNDLT